MREIAPCISPVFPIGAADFPAAPFATMSAGRRAAVRGWTMIETRGAGRFERIAFLSSGTPEADTARDDLSAIYGNVPPLDADVIVALGATG